ncbi:MAG: glycosyltransferase involved in cell wall biosynthesis [Cognaticolwellia sp.]
MKTVSIIGTVGIPACYGGFETLVENLVRYHSNKIEYEVFCSKYAYKEYLTECYGAKLTYIPLNANGVQSIPYDIISLMQCIFKKPDVTLILGVSGCLFLPVYRFFSKSKVVTNIDGLEWKRDKWSKWAKKFLKLSESIAVKYSDVIITDNKAIADYVAAEYSKDNVIIAYGGDHAIIEGTNVGPEQDYYLSLCRIEPENNVQMILSAFAKSQHKLKFVGNWNSSEFGKELKRTFTDKPNIEIVDPIYNVNQLFKLRSECKGYIHGHSAGGTNPSLVEAMHFEKPIFAFDCNFNRYSTEDKAIYFATSQELNEKLTKVTIDELSVISTDMKQIAESRYTWKVINDMYEATYL